MSRNTCLTSFDNFDATRIIFQTPKKDSFEEKDSTSKGITIEYTKVFIGYRNEDGSEGDLIISTPRLFSFGVSKNLMNGQVKGYSFPICLQSINGPTDDESKFIRSFDDIVNKCIDHLLNIKDDIDLFELEKKDLVKAKGGLNPIYYKRETFTDPVDGKKKLRVVPGTSPMLYPKLFFSTKKEKFLTNFYHSTEVDSDNDPVVIDPLDLVEKRCHAECAIKIESIFIGAGGKNISLQVKLYEACIEPMNTSSRRLLKPSPKVDGVDRFKTDTNAVNPMMSSSMDNDDTNSINGDDPHPTVSIKKTTTRNVRSFGSKD